eukprot:4721058-Pyramimonas_sp.AAC.1
MQTPARGGPSFRVDGRGKQALPTIPGAPTRRLVDLLTSPETMFLPQDHVGLRLREKLFHGGPGVPMDSLQAELERIKLTRAELEGALGTLRRRATHRGIAGATDALDGAVVART